MEGLSLAAVFALSGTVALAAAGGALSLVLHLMKLAPVQKVAARQMPELERW